MKILAIETSCDETAVAILEITEKKGLVSVHVLGNALLSQTAIHTLTGGVVPSLAKREHANNLIPMLTLALKDANVLKQRITTQKLTRTTTNSLKKLLSHEPDLFDDMIEFMPTLIKPPIDAIAVTYGPGLEPALWVGINFAKALSMLWKKPVVPVNHMEGHVLSALLKESEAQNVKRKTFGKKVDTAHFTLHVTKFPLVSLLISGGHTELVLTTKPGSYKLIGETRDDAIGEAYDKVARMLGLSYPGGPQISRLAEEARAKNIVSTIKLPRPMLHSGDLDFSFAGLKTAVLYTLKKIKNGESHDISSDLKLMIAREFEDAVAEVLASKVQTALETTGAKTFAVGGGVIANKNIRAVLTELIAGSFPDVKLYLPTPNLTTDNAIMIGLAGYMKSKSKSSSKIKAEGGLKLK